MLGFSDVEVRSVARCRWRKVEFRVLVDEEAELALFGCVECIQGICIVLRRRICASNSAIDNLAREIKERSFYMHLLIQYDQHTSIASFIRTG